jgi:crossover junction endodeoxyribonuclease RusA
VVTTQHQIGRAEITLTLPWPVSANRYWRTYQPWGFKSVVTVVSKEAKAYKNQVLLLARRAGILRPLCGKVSVHLQLYPKRPLDWKKRQTADPLGWDMSVKCLDIDNARKVLYDALKNVVFEDDCMVWQDSAERMVPDGMPGPDGSGGRVLVTVREL